MMNERIRQLAEQVYGTQATEQEIKFAELIVQECLKIVEPDRTSGDEWCVTLDETAYSIKQHFGVKE